MATGALSRRSRGGAAIADARLAYCDYLQLLESPLWKPISAKGARSRSKAA